jgi:hypothetical protein
MKFIDDLVARFAQFCKKVVEFDTRKTVEIQVGDYLVDATILGQRENLYKVNYEDPRDGIYRTKWLVLTPEQIAGLNDPLELTHKS